MRKIFTDDEIIQLSQNPYVLKCSEKAITYTYEFKIRALKLHSQGVTSKDIWRQAGFKIDNWKNDYCKDTLKEWKQIVNRKGFEGLTTLRGVAATGRPKTKGLTDLDKIKRLELQVKYLRAENDFLAKLRAKRAESNSGQRKNLE